MLSDKEQMQLSVLEYLAPGQWSSRQAIRAAMGFPTGMTLGWLHNVGCVAIARGRTTEYMIMPTGRATLADLREQAQEVHDGDTKA